MVAIERAGRVEVRYVGCQLGRCFRFLEPVGSDARGGRSVSLWGPTERVQHRDHGVHVCACGDQRPAYGRVASLQCRKKRQSPVLIHSSQVRPAGEERLHHFKEALGASNVQRHDALVVRKAVVCPSTEQEFACLGAGALGGEV